MLTISMEGVVMVGLWMKDKVSIVTLIPLAFHESESNLYRQLACISNHGELGKTFHEWYPESHPVNKISNSAIEPHSKVIDIKHLKVRRREITLQPGDRLFTSQKKCSKYTETVLNITVDYIKVINVNGEINELSYNNICNRAPIASYIESIHDELSAAKKRFMVATRKKVKGIESVFSWDST